MSSFAADHTVKQPGEWWMLALTSLGFFMSMMDSMIVSTASAAIRNDFSVSLAQLQWVLNAYNITMAALLLVGVAYGAHIGRRNMYVIGLLVFTAGSACAALSPDFSLLLGSRVVQGVGASVMTPMSMAILSASVPVERRGRALGIWSAVGGLALIAGPSLGGLIVATLSWQWIFWINIPIGLATAYFALKKLPFDSGNAMRPKPLDAALIVIAPAAFVYALSQSTSGTPDMLTLAIGAFGIICAIAFTALQRVRRNPLVPLHMFRSRMFNIGAIGTFLLYAAMYGTVFFLPQFLQLAQGANALTAGLEILPWTGTLVVVSPFAGKMADTYGERTVAVVGFILQTAGYGWIAFASHAHTPYATTAIALAVCGAGISMAGPALQKAMLGSVDRKYITNASGVFNISRQLAGAVGTAISVMVFYQFGTALSHSAFTQGFTAVMTASALTCLISGTATLWIDIRK
jgi:EmrB/QacA subfamily drug resistance transporter